MNDQLAKSAFNYLGTIYEGCVDKSMNMREIQAHLSRKGIHKPMLAIKHDLNCIFCFPGYVDAHPAPAMQSAADFDRQLGG